MFKTIFCYSLQTTNAVAKFHYTRKGKKAKKKEFGDRNVFERLRLDRTSDWNRMEVKYKAEQQIHWFYDCIKRPREVNRIKQWRSVIASAEVLQWKIHISDSILHSLLALEWDLTNAWIYWHGLSLDEQSLQAPRITAYTGCIYFPRLLLCDT